MIDHISSPVSDFARSRAFYDKALAAVGYKAIMEITDAPDYVGAGYGPDRTPEARFWIGASPVPAPAPVNPDGQHIAFQADRQGVVDSFHTAALGAGGTNDGAPGLRPRYHPNYHAAYGLDPD